MHRTYDVCTVNAIIPLRISQLLSHIRDKAVQYREAERGEALIGLSTCADDVGTNGRVVIFGWLEETPAGREV